MKAGCLLFIAAVGIGTALPSARAYNADLEEEIKKIDAQAADPDRKPIVAAAIAERLKMHRNHLVLLRKETGQSYGHIFVSRLEATGAAQDDILRQAKGLNREIERRLTGRGNDSQRERETSGVRPLLFVNTAVDHSSAATFYSVVPQIGIESHNIALVVGLPYYDISAPALSSHGIGDIYATGLMTVRAGLLEVGGDLTAGFPTGDRSLGLGAGKTTYDATGRVTAVLGPARPFVYAGVANSIFSNAVYQRPYISDGAATHFSGGVEIRATPHLTFGAGGFAVRPSGTQVLISRVASPGRTAQKPGQGKAMGPPTFDNPTPTEVAATDLRDHGPNVWISIFPHRAVSLNFSVARSIPFQLTTVRFGLGFNVGRLIFPRGRS